ncbi:hypothetical protein [Pseudoruegeria sp. SK021]|uniref:hypothetical protein n=1 Tax=Pseudoruegeria sp. SK021 TaxID=1933035 RepID=UPI000A22939C|nr:hypothetical protein [Pseudoruegeria sp. SK021]OSP55493.1 hypothetical protein BV911_07580 [Pseudoruegeria sp. SK021]
MRLLILFVILWLSACTPEGLPDDPHSSTIDTLAMPEILPLHSLLLLAESDLPAAADPDPDLAQRGADLRARAEAIRAAAP